MRRYLGMVLRWSVLPLLVVLAVSTGGAEGFVGWFVLAWMVFRGGPGMWGDVRRVFGALRGRRWSFRRRSGAGSELNA